MTASDIWAVVPIKELDGAKQRLAPLLTPAQRRALIEVMMSEVLEAVITTPSLAGTMVVTVDPQATALAKRLDARVVTDGARDGHTGSVTAACAARPRRTRRHDHPAGRHSRRHLGGDQRGRWRRTCRRPSFTIRRRMTTSAPTPSSARRPTPCRCASAKTATTRISMRRRRCNIEPHGRSISRASPWTSTIPPTSRPSSPCRSRSARAPSAPGGDGRSEAVGSGSLIPIGSERQWVMGVAGGRSKPPHQPLCLSGERNLTAFKPRPVARRGQARSAPGRPRRTRRRGAPRRPSP